MENQFKITVPKPCHENWDKMNPENAGRFCNSCSKTVVDFTNMNATEIQNYFSNNKEKSVCGRLKDEQLDTIILKIPPQVLFTQIQFHKIFMFALLICMGTSLLSCEYEDGSKQKIDGVEVADPNEERIIMGAMSVPSKEEMKIYDSIQKIPSK